MITCRPSQWWNLFWCASLEKTQLKRSALTLSELVPGFIVFWFIFFWFSSCTSEMGVWIESYRSKAKRSYWEAYVCGFVFVYVSVFRSICLFSVFLILLSLFFFFQDTPRSRSHKRWVWLHPVSVSGWMRCFSIALHRGRSKGLNSFSRWPQLCTIHPSGGFCQMYKHSPGLKICLSETAEKNVSCQKKGI